LQVPESPALEQAGETLETLGTRYQDEMLKVIFEAICVDIETHKLVCVKPHSQFVPIFRLDGLEERNGFFYEREKA
jgi:hypothetical protein